MWKVPKVDEAIYAVAKMWDEIIHDITQAR
jgi:hypothetical protein